MKTTEFTHVLDLMDKLYSADPEDFRRVLIGQAVSYWNNQPYSDLSPDEPINYSGTTEELGWPDFQDGGIFEQAIEVGREISRLSRNFVGSIVH